MAVVAFASACSGAAARLYQSNSRPVATPRPTPPVSMSRPAPSPSSKTVLITGSTDGIGFHTAKTLAASGWRVLVHGRSPHRTAAALESVRAAATGAAPEAFVADLSRPADVRRLAEDISAVGALDVLVNNAGVFELNRSTVGGGIEMTFAVNVLAPFLLTRLLLPLMRAGGSRVVNISSISHNDGGRTRKGGTVDWDDLQSEKAYDAYSSYGLSKLLILMFSYSMAGVDDGADGGLALSNTSPGPVTVVTLDPGTVSTKMLRAGWGNCGVAVEAAGDEAWAITSGDVANGAYYVGRKQRKSAAETYQSASRVRLWAELICLTKVWEEVS